MSQLVLWQWWLATPSSRERLTDTSRRQDKSIISFKLTRCKLANIHIFLHNFQQSHPPCMKKTSGLRTAQDREKVSCASSRISHMVLKNMALENISYGVGGSVSHVNGPPYLGWTDLRSC